MGNQDYNVNQLLQMEACTNCRICADVCPAVTASSEGELSAVYRMKGLKEILKGRTGLFRKLFGRKEPFEKKWRHFSDTVLHPLRDLPGGLPGRYPPQRLVAVSPPGPGSFRMLS